MLGKNVANMDVAVVVSGGDNIGDLRFMRIAHHPLNAGHGGQFFENHGSVRGVHHGLAPAKWRVPGYQYGRAA